MIATTKPKPKEFWTPQKFRLAPTGEVRQKREPATHFDHIHYVRYLPLEERTMQLPPKDLGSQTIPLK